MPGPLMAGPTNQLYDMTQDIPQIIRFLASLYTPPNQAQGMPMGQRLPTGPARPQMTPQSPMPTATPRPYPNAMQGPPPYISPPRSMGYQLGAARQNRDAGPRVGAIPRELRFEDGSVGLDYGQWQGPMQQPMQRQVPQEDNSLPTILRELYQMLFPI